MTLDDHDLATAALATVRGLGPARLRILLDHHEPGDALDRLARRRPLHPMVERSFGRDLPAIGERASRASVAEVGRACAVAGVRVLRLGTPGYPVQLLGDPRAPAAVFVRGDVEVLDARRVGIVGTRNATASGVATARELGAALASEGVVVVSGLARGIDGAAHRGVRGVADGAPPVAVVANGPDRPYPRRHAELWEWVASRGLLLSEWPPGVGPDAWRFPQRNRILAALCEVLVVVESRERGGSLITARAAADRGIEVMAVPGSPRQRAAAGTNRLLVDGAAPVTAAADVLAMLGLDHRRQGVLPFDPRPMPVGVQSVVLDACRAEPCTLDTIVARTGIPLADAAIAAARLERDGWLIEAAGWFEPAGSRLEAR